MKIHLFWCEFQFLLVMASQCNYDIRLEVLIDVDAGLAKDDISHSLEMPGMDGFKPEFSKNFKFVNLVKAFLN